jgi:DNA-binding transcriptional LysR family regulator
MDTLNYHHLKLFWAVGREGNLTGASAKLHLTPQTISGQIGALEASLDEQLFLRSGRRLVLTEIGRVVLRHADDIFSTGQELLETLRGQPTGRPLRLRVGVADGVPGCLDGAPVLRPSADAVLRLALDEWFSRCGVRPVIAGLRGSNGDQRRGRTPVSGRADWGDG